MEKWVTNRLLSINKEFYRHFALPFAQSRAHLQPGFYKLRTFLPDNPFDVLDVGCGEGRFGRFLSEQGSLFTYTGVDFSPQLTEFAASESPGTYIIRDLSQANCLLGLGLFDVVVCLATLQHIPSRDNRRRLLAEMASHLREHSWIFLSNWQFRDSPRQMKKVMDWSLVGLDSKDVDVTDYLLSWSRGGKGVRYVAYLNQDEIARMADAVQLNVVKQFRSDGREGDLNLYSVLSN